jgi:ACR3 family arsenite transporter
VGGRLLRLSALLRAGLAPLAALGMVAGLAVGSRYHLPHPELFIQLAIFAMIYPMLLGVAPQDLGRTLASGRVLTGSLLLNFIVSPALALGLALLFLRGEPPEFSAGLVLIGLVPCGNMGAFYTTLAGGNAVLAMGILALTYVLDLPLVPLLSKLFVGRFISVPLGLLAGYLFWILLLPLGAAAATRRVVRGRAGEEGLSRLAEAAAGFSTLGLMAVVFVICSMRAQDLLARPQVLLKLCLPVPLLFGALAVLAAAWSRLFRLEYPDAIALMVTSVTKNAALALALATLTFGPLAALPIILAGPFLQVPLILIFVRLAPHLRPWLERGR